MGVGVGWVLGVGVAVAVGVSCGIPPVASGRSRFLDRGFLLRLMHLVTRWIWFSDILLSFVIISLTLDACVQLVNRSALPNLRRNGTQVFNIPPP